MKCWLAFAFSLAGLLAMATQSETPKGEPFRPPSGGALWQHEKTGLAFPAKLGSLRLGYGFTYETPELGISLRYVDEASRARADIYLYPCARPHEDADEVSTAIKDEGRAVLDEVEGMGRLGRYTEITHDDANLGEFEFRSGKKSARLTMLLHLTTQEDAGAGVTPVRVESLVDLTLYRDYWVKIRYTMPAEMGKKGEEARDAFVKKAFRCVMAADWRKEVEDQIARYRRDRLSKDAEEGGATVVAYADQFPLVELTVGQSLTSFGAACEKRFAKGTEHVLRAFIVGATEATLEGRTQAEVVTAAVREVGALCEAWCERDSTFKPPSLANFETEAMKENKVKPIAKTSHPDGNHQKRN
jgi:hypothetical protein